MRFSVDFSKAFLVLLWHSAPIWVGISILITLLGLIIAELEGLTFGNGLYFAWVTGTTVGYGDLTPTLVITRVLAIIVAIFGIVFTGIIVSLALSAAKIAIQSSGSLDEMKRKAEAAANKRISQLEEQSTC